MTVLPPVPGKRPFGHPLGEDILAHFRHPLPRSVWHHAYRFDATTWFGNGYMLLCSDSTYLFAGARDVQHPDRFHDVLARFQWDRLLATLRCEVSDWVPFEEVRTDLFRSRPQPLWEEHKGGQVFRSAPTVRIGQHLVQLATVQLLSRLPDVHYCAPPGGADPFFVRFRSGCGVVNPVPFLFETHAFRLPAVPAAKRLRPQ